MEANNNSETPNARQHNYELLWTCHSTTLWALMRFAFTIESASLAAAFLFWNDQQFVAVLAALAIGSLGLAVTLSQIIRTGSFLKLLKQQPDFLFSETRIQSENCFKNTISGEKVSFWMSAFMLALNLVFLGLSLGALFNVFPNQLQP